MGATFADSAFPELLAEDYGVVAPDYLGDEVVLDFAGGTGVGVGAHGAVGGWCMFGVGVLFSAVWCQLLLIENFKYVSIGETLGFAIGVNTYWLPPGLPHLMRNLKGTISSLVFILETVMDDFSESRWSSGC